MEIKVLNKEVRVFTVKTLVYGLGVSGTYDKLFSNLAINIQIWNRSLCLRVERFK